MLFETTQGAAAVCLRFLQRCIVAHSNLQYQRTGLILPAGITVAVTEAVKQLDIFCSAAKATLSKVIGLPPHPTEREIR